MTEDTIKAPTPGEKTGRQIGGAVFGGTLPGAAAVVPGTYGMYRAMRADPTIAIARQLVIAPILASPWSIEVDGASAEAITLITDMFQDQRPHILNTALRTIDYGWAGFEKVFEIRDGRQWLSKFKPLYPDITEIQVDEAGRFAGFHQGDVIIPIENALLYTHDQEGDEYYGRSRMENVRRVYSQWLDANDGAARYDRKIAGAWIVVHYPMGMSKDRSGTEKPNWEIAQQILNGIVSSGSIAVPNTYAQEVDELNNQRPEKRQWLIEVLEDKGGRQPQFGERLRYLDSLKMRGFLRPERAALEGQHGTKAEAESHHDTFLTESELLHQQIVRVVNWHAVDQVLALNFGEQARGTVWISPAPLQDTKREIFKQVFMALLANPTTMLELFATIDKDALFDALDIPKVAQNDRPPTDLPDLLKARLSLLAHLN